MNPNHDEHGRFATGDGNGANAQTFRTADTMAKAAGGPSAMVVSSYFTPQGTVLHSVTLPNSPDVRKGRGLLEDDTRGSITWVVRDGTPEQVRAAIEKKGGVDISASNAAEMKGEAKASGRMSRSEEHAFGRLRRMK